MQRRKYVRMADDHRRESPRHCNCRYSVVPQVVEYPVEECADVSLMLQNVAAPNQVELPLQRHPEVIGVDVGRMARNDIDSGKIFTKEPKSPGTYPASRSDIEHGVEIVLRQYLCKAKMRVIKFFFENSGGRNQL